MAQITSNKLGEAVEPVSLGIRMRMMMMMMMMMMMTLQKKKNMGTKTPPFFETHLNKASFFKAPMFVFWGVILITNPNKYNHRQP